MLKSNTSTVARGHLPIHTQIQDGGDGKAGGVGGGEGQQADRDRGRSWRIGEGDYCELPNGDNRYHGKQSGPVDRSATADRLTVAENRREAEDGHIDFNTAPELCSVGAAVHPNKPCGLCGRKATLNLNTVERDRAQELCESRGGRPGLPVPNKPCGFCGLKAALNRTLTPLTKPVPLGP